MRVQSAYLSIMFFITLPLHAGDTKDFLTTFERANSLFRDGKTEASIEAYKSAIAISGNYAEAYFNLGLAYERNNEIEEATIAYRKAARLKPEYAKAHERYGSALIRQKRYEEAIEPLKKTIELEAHNTEAHLNLARAYTALNMIQDACRAFSRTLEINPRHATAMLEYANMLNMNHFTEQSLELYLVLNDLAPNNASIAYNTAYTFKKLNRLAEAMPYYQKVLSINPEHPEARFSLGLAHLVMGNFKDGWRGYEYRLDKPEGITLHQYAQPLWDGSDLHGKIIYLHAEQGLGDTFQFIRYAILAKNKGGYVVVGVQNALVDIIKQCPYIDVVVPLNHLPSQFDVHASLLSLPFLLRHNVETDFPTDIPYLHAQPELVDMWREKLSSDRNFKIGICWQGNPNYSTQFLRAAVAAKSMQLAQLEPLSHLPNVSIYSLQLQSGTEQIDQILPAFKEKIHFFEGDFDTTHGRFMDTAAVITNLDLVITIDTSIAHFAAGLGTPTWNLLPNPPDWRWMLDREDTPWYPNMRLFRQPKPGDWESVINDVVEELKKVL